MGEYSTGGRKVSFTDADTLRDVADLYAVVQGEYEGTPSAASDALKNMLGALQAGRPLSDGEWTFFHRMHRRYQTQLADFRKSPKNEEEGFVPLPPTGTGRIGEALSVLSAGERRRMQEQYSTSSTTAKDRQTTPPHLLDGALHDLAHAVQHGKRLNDADVRSNPASLDFNVEHMMKHVVSGLDHIRRMGQHLEEHPSNPKTFKTERQTLNSMREAEHLASPSTQARLREHKASPPPNLREATVPHECCGTCAMFWENRCWGYGQVRVESNWVCDSWDADTVLSVMGESRPAVRRMRPMREDAKVQICIDFDGVIYDRSIEPQGDNLAGRLIKGAPEGLASLAKLFRLIVLTARPNSKSVRRWLDEQGVGGFISEVTNVKPSAAAYVDNRALLFHNWSQLVKDLEKGDQSPYETDIPGGKT